METIIGLGKTGCYIADQFADYEQYKIYKVGTGLKGLKKNGIYSLPACDDPEKYEQKCPSFKNFLKNVEGEILFVVNGAEFISATSLRILKALKELKCEINVLYIRPDVDYIPEKNEMNERVVCNVLQEYARSGVLERIFLVDMLTVESLLDDLPLSEYYSKIYQLISSTLHMINVYSHIDSVSDTFSPPHEAARISTIGISNSEDEVKLFFPLDNADEIRYYYAINEDKLKSDGKLLKKIKEQIKEQTSEEVKASYGVYSTDYEQDYLYVLAHSLEIQK
jgi:hypothetical protein